MFRLCHWSAPPFAYARSVRACILLSKFGQRWEKPQRGYRRSKPCLELAMWQKELRLREGSERLPHFAADIEGWCSRRESNPHGLAATGFSVRRVCQFRHSSFKGYG